MRRLLRFARNVGAQCLYRLGLLRLIVKFRLRDQSVVLTYHRVLDARRASLANSHSGIVVSDRAFDMHMRVLRSDFNPVSLATFQSHLENGTALPPRSVLVTFDDGWLDNLDVALPIIKKYDIPAVIFLPVHYIASNAMFWQEEVTMRLSGMLAGSDARSSARLASLLKLGDKSKAPTRGDIEQYVTELKSLDYSQLSEKLEIIRREAPVDRNSDHYNRYLSWEQVADMREAGIDFASHALSHRILPALPLSQCREELVQSRKELEHRLGGAVRAIAYPNGGYNEEVVEETGRAGYTLAFTTNAGFVDGRTDPLRIPRINVHQGNSHSEARFICTIARVL